MQVSTTSFGLLLGKAECWACHQSTPAATVWVPSFHFRHEPGDDEEVEEDPAVLSYIEQISAGALTAITANAPWMTMAPTRTIGITYLVNRCTHCDEVQGDHYLHKPGAPFFPLEVGDVVHLKYVPCQGPLTATCSPGQSSWMREVEKCVGPGPG